MAPPADIALSASFVGDWDTMDVRKYADEDLEVAALLEEAPLSSSERPAVQARAKAIVETARRIKRRKGMMESFLEEFGLSTQEGLALMCLAEALLRVPDAATADKLIAEKIKDGRWGEHVGKAGHWLVNAGTWGLMLTGRLVAAPSEKDIVATITRLLQRAGEPVVRAAAMQGMRILGEQFVLGRSIEEALKRGEGQQRAGAATTFSFDMLGEGARTAADAERYLASYAAAIDAVGRHEAEASDPTPAGRSGLSVKLSALHPRYEARLQERVMAELYPKVRQLAVQAKGYNLALCLDAEEADRLALSLKLLDRLAADPALEGWDGLGIAVQAYQKRARDVINAVAALARARGRTLMMRLVKGAYWDGEVKKAQQAGRPDYPVFTTKAATDVSYLACAKLMLANADVLSCAFATHNAHTVAAIVHLADAAGVSDYEFQRLHGMGEALYAAAGLERPVRVYAPVGGHEDLLPYLVRRLLENGANTSFVHSFLDDSVSADLVAADPIAALAAAPGRHRRLPPPRGLYGPSRENPLGADLAKTADRALLTGAVGVLRRSPIAAAPLVSGAEGHGTARPAASPSAPGRKVGTVVEASPAQVTAAIAAAHAYQRQWNALGALKRAAILRKAADALEAGSARFIALIAEEAGRTYADGVDEVREAVDFLRYYAAEAETHFARALTLPGPAGETNHLELMGRGVFGCIAPWNFPLAIFLGQVAAALAAGNTVLAKPAEQTPLVGFEAVKLLHAAGVPFDALHFLPGGGRIGAAIAADPRVAGIAFTGSTATARRIAQTLATREGPLATLIAETGGLNGLFVDTTALKEQVVDDALLSAFGSAGQRCSALRVLFLPEATADAILETLTGALAELKLGDPADPTTDIGPVIDADALAMLKAHKARMAAEARIVAEAGPVPAEGYFFAPMIVELHSLNQVTEEIFGPILHVVRYDPAAIASVGAQLAAKGFGLTLGVHSRLESFMQQVIASVPAGNVYVNRSLIGAVVGVQPFGGLGLSGTGPKAGGPHYLLRFAAERTITVNVAAQGGDPALLNL
jgi:RHH-type proline utilization regulon transcriptional repressor/proline dehydrogenase/delta 1-pyrroline-5-carboxylate dehydrogenase